MNTLILNSNNLSDLARAAEILKDGGIIATPTDTIYGIAADMQNEKAVDKIYEIKKRPRCKPLVVQISDVVQLESLTPEVNKNAQILINEFWPGPLTLVFRKSRTVPNYVVSGTPLVGIRLPDSSTVRAIIRSLCSQVVVTSANISGKPSLTTFEEIIDALYGKIDAIIKGTDNKASNIASTIVSVAGKIPKLLRCGEIQKEKIEKYLRIL